MYPQPSSVAPVLGGQEFFRLKTELLSTGDIYESEVSALGFAIGPSSDIANVEITYLDRNIGSVAQANISPSRAIVGRLDARNDGTYPDQRKGRILIAPTDNYSPDWRPADFDADTIEYVPPIIDVLQYFTNPPSLTPARSDREFQFAYLQPAPPAGNRTFLMIPAYGRKSGYFSMLNLTATAQIVKIGGVRFGPTASSPNAFNGMSAYNSDLAHDNNLVQYATFTYPFQASVGGIWDYFVISIGTTGAGEYQGGPFPITVTLSDDAL